MSPRPHWLLLGIFDWRSGTPYSTVSEALDFVGARNVLRFPTYRRLEVGLERRIKIIATLGPATVDKAVITGLVRAGADVFRINMSHTDHAMLAAYAARYRALLAA